MGSKKKTGPMWTEVKDVRRARIGDLLIWPAEKGRINHLHGSVSTMRKLGFSVGRRWNAASYEQIRFLTERPNETRVFIAVETSAAYSSDDVMSFGDQSSPMVRDLSLRELPLHLIDGQTDPVAAVLTRDFGNDLLKPVIGSGLFGQIGDHYGSSSTDWLGDDVLNIANRLGSTMRTDCARQAAEDERCLSPHVVSGILTAAHCQMDEYCTGHKDKFQLKMPVQVLVNATRYGARLIRPTDDFLTGIYSMVASHAFGLLAGQHAALLDNITLVERQLKDFRKRIDRCMRFMRSSAKTGAKVAFGPLKALSEITGVSPDFRFHLTEEKEKCSTIATQTAE